MSAIDDLNAAHVAGLQKIIADGTKASAPLRAQAQALAKQALELEGGPNGDVARARQQLQQFQQQARRQAPLAPKVPGPKVG